jgi:hypothetical protein
MCNFSYTTLKLLRFDQLINFRRDKNDTLKPQQSTSDADKFARGNKIAIPSSYSANRHFGE